MVGAVVILAAGVAVALTNLIIAGICRVVVWLKQSIFVGTQEVKKLGLHAWKAQAVVRCALYDLAWQILHHPNVMLKM
jgi:hypothetical protein